MKGWGGKGKELGTLERKSSTGENKRDCFHKKGPLEKLKRRKGRTWDFLFRRGDRNRLIGGEVPLGGERREKSRKIRKKGGGILSPGSMMKGGPGQGG